MASISSILSDCLKQFNNLVASNTLQQIATEVSPDLWRDELGRLRVWAANIGAHQTGRSSLDYRLRDASNIRDQVIRLLNAARRAFDDLEDVLQESEGGHIPIEDDSEPEDNYGSEVQQIFKGLVNTIDCLFQISMVIRRPTKHDQFMGIKKADSAPFEPYDQQHVANKFPRAEPDIKHRLGTAISRRRAGLRYRERHRAKLSKGLNSTLGNQSETGSTVLSETVATEFEESQRIRFDETASNSGVSQTSYAQTLLESNDRISIPPPPKGATDGKSFECPYCFFVITIRDNRSWIRHIFADLMPYVCVFPDCSTPTMLYASRREWYHHLQNSHSIQAEQVAGIQCPLCQEEPTNGDRLDRHVGRHLEELALFALPRLDEEEEDSVSKKDAESKRHTDMPHSEQSDDDDARLDSSASSGRMEDWEKTVSSDTTKDEANATLERLMLESSVLKEQLEREKEIRGWTSNMKDAGKAVIASEAAYRSSKETEAAEGEQPEESFKAQRTTELLETAAENNEARRRGVFSIGEVTCWVCCTCKESLIFEFYDRCIQCGHHRCPNC